MTANNKLERMWKEVTRTTKRTLRITGVPALPKYKTEKLPLQPTCSVLTIVL
jgi:hypothetical protein